MANSTEIEAAAKVLACGKSKGVLTKAGVVLASLKHAVETIVGKEVEALKRTSRSTGTERLAFLLGKVNMRGAMSAEESAAAGAMLAKSERVFNHLKARGLDAERVNLGSTEPGVLRHCVDVVLNDKVLRYVPGSNSASVLRNTSIAKSL